MKIKLRGQQGQTREIKLNDNHVKIARGIVGNFLDCMKAGASKHNVPALYFTILITMYSKSSELLNAMTLEGLQTFMDVANFELDGDKFASDAEETFKALNEVMPKAQRPKTNTEENQP